MNPIFWKPRYRFALYWSKTIWDKHVFLHVAIATDGCNVIGRHNFLAQTSEAKIVSLISVHSHAHHFASASYYTATDLYSVVYETAKALLMQLWKCLTCFTVAIGLLGYASDHIYYVYMVSFSLSHYHIWITSGLVLNVICWVSALKEPMRWPPRQEDVSLWSARGLVRAVLG